MCKNREWRSFFVEKKTENKIEDGKSNLTLENRKKLILSGVVEVISFDEQKIDLTTKLGNLTIKGEELKMNKLDVQNGEVIIAGSILSMVYNGKVSKKSNESIISKLFK
jgi:sporulation protein YabP